MMDWSIDAGSSLPPSRQLVEKVLDALARASLEAGDQLPSVRKMAGLALVNHNTVARAYRDLEQLGAVAGQNGRGVFVTPEGPTIAKDQRKGSTLEAFEQAALEALRAGHDPQSLLDILQGLHGQVPRLSKQDPKGPRKSA